jgi:mono/diheme cytochrome c family protein
MKIKIGFFAFVVLGILYACKEPIQLKDIKKNDPNNHYGEQPVIAGVDLYTTHCTACHGADGNMGVAGAKKIPASVLTLDERIELITHGKKTMPAFNEKLNTDEIKRLAEYTLTLK